MDLMLRDRNFRKVQVIKKPSYACNSGLYGASKNDFQLVLSEEQPFPIGYMVTWGTSELGGVILRRMANTKERTMTYIGKTFRGAMENSIVYPFAPMSFEGTDYEVISDILQRSQLGYKVLPTGHTSRKTIIVPAGSNTLKAVDLALNSFGEKMLFKVSNDGVEISIVPVNEISFDASQVDLVVDENRMLPTALRALGNGGIRTVVYAQSDGTIGTTKYYKGFEAVEIVENISADTNEELLELAKARLLALRSTQNASEVNANIEDADIGDKINVSVKKYGVKATQTVSEKILKIEGKNEEIIYNTGG